MPASGWQVQLTQPPGAVNGVLRSGRRCRDAGGGSGAQNDGSRCGIRSVRVSVLKGSSSNPASHHHPIENCRPLQASGK